MKNTYIKALLAIFAIMLSYVTHASMGLFKKSVGQRQTKDQVMQATDRDNIMREARDATQFPEMPEIPHTETEIMPETRGRQEATQEAQKKEVMEIVPEERQRVGEDFTDWSW